MRISRRPDFLVYVDGEGGYWSSGILREYREHQNRQKLAQACLEGFLKVRQFVHTLPEIDLREPTQFSPQPR
jgi:hypothetical protein